MLEAASAELHGNSAPVTSRSSGTHSCIYCYQELQELRVCIPSKQDLIKRLPGYNAFCNSDIELLSLSIEDSCTTALTFSLYRTLDL